MNVTEPVLTDSKTLNEVVNCLTEHIPIQTQGQCDGVLHEKIWAAFVRFICVPRRVPVVIRLPKFLGDKCVNNRIFLKF